MEIIKAQQQHLDLIVPLFNAYRVFYEQSSDVVMAREFLADRLQNEDSVIFLCLENEIPVGFTQLYPVFSSVSCQGDYILNDLFVASHARGKGVAKQLLRHAQAFTKARGFKGLALETQKNNYARFLYEKLGWKAASNLHYYWTA